jgi:hypothetical protein
MNGKREIAEVSSRNFGNFEVMSLEVWRVSLVLTVEVDGN